MAGSASPRATVSSMENGRSMKISMPLMMSAIVSHRQPDRQAADAQGGQDGDVEAQRAGMKTRTTIQTISLMKTPSKDNTSCPCA